MLGQRAGICGRSRDIYRLAPGARRSRVAKTTRGGRRSLFLAKAIRDVGMRSGANLKLQHVRAHRGVKGSKVADFEVNWKRHCKPEAADIRMPEARYAKGLGKLLVKHKLKRHGVKLRLEMAVFPGRTKCTYV